MIITIIECYVLIAAAPLQQQQHLNKFLVKQPSLLVRMERISTKWTNLLAFMFHQTSLFGFLKETITEFWSFPTHTPLETVLLQQYFLEQVWLDVQTTNWVILLACMVTQTTTYSLLTFKTTEFLGLWFLKWNSLFSFCQKKKKVSQCFTETKHGNNWSCFWSIFIVNM